MKFNKKKFLEDMKDIAKPFVISMLIYILTFEILTYFGQPVAGAILGFFLAFMSIFWIDMIKSWFE